MNDAIRYSDIPGYPGYRIGNDGTLWSCRYSAKGRKGYDSYYLSENWRQLRTYLTDRGYHQVKLSSAELRPRWIRIHQLVARAFVPNPTAKPEVNHKNGDKSDNSASNLEWTTRAENVRHAFRTGLHKPQRGEQCSHAKLTKQDVFALRSLRRNGQTLVSLAKQFGVSKTAIWNVMDGRSWRHAQDRYVQRELFTEATA